MEKNKVPDLNKYVIIQGGRGNCKSLEIISSMLDYIREHRAEKGYCLISLDEMKNVLADERKKALEEVRKKAMETIGHKVWVTSSISFEKAFNKIIDEVLKGEEV